MRFESGHMFRQLLGILRDQGRTTASLAAGSCFPQAAASTSGRVEHTLWQVAHGHGSSSSTTRTFHSAALRLTRLHTEVWDESKAPALATSGLPFGSPLPTDPFALAQPEVDAISERLRRSVASSIPSLSQAAEYFFRMGVEGKRLRPTLIMLMASALSSQPPSVESLTVDLRPASEHASEPRRRQQRIAEIAEIMHVASLLHDDVIDEAPTRRGILSLNSKAGNKMAILAGDFLLARASVSLAALRNTAIVELMSQILEHLVSGEVMQMTASQEQVLSMDHYLEKTYCKTASLMANSSRAVAVLGGHTPEVCDMAWGYGKHLGLAFQIVDDILDLTASSSILGKPSHSDIRSGLATAPVLFAAEQQPKLKQLIARRFKHEGDVDMAVQLLEATTGIQQAKDLANHHCAMAAQMIQSLPSPQSEHAIQARNALINITQRVLNRKK